ncbi:hypothetical protein V5799_010263 [Amblyomma americanum]|uniref:Uncharacterized protein n=1 Tax=Amblyomma americanum TaxID=6943 RepID=A0AAQ4F959_AMBAM
MRVATDFVWACKKTAITMNIPGAIYRETNRLCVALHLCYSYAEECTKNANVHQRCLQNCFLKASRITEVLHPHYLEDYNLNVTEFTAKIFKCGGHLLPKDYRYALRTVEVVRNFVTG